MNTDPRLNRPRHNEIISAAAPVMPCGDDNAADAVVAYRKALEAHAVALYNPKNRTGGDEIDVTFLKHAEPGFMLVLSRSAGYTGLDEMTIEQAREIYRVRLGQGYFKLEAPRYRFAAIDYCGRLCEYENAPAVWPPAKGSR